MELALDLAKIIIPAVMVFLTAYFVLKSYLENQQKHKLIELKMDQKKFALPLRLQAYERMALLLERISPENLIMRVNTPDLNAISMQNALIQAIRMEFEHNLAQQIYVSDQAWELVKNAKEDVIRIINTAASKMNENSSNIDLSTAVFEEALKAKDGAISKALSYLKSEGRAYLDA